MWAKSISLTAISLWRSAFRNEKWIRAETEQSVSAEIYPETWNLKLLNAVKKDYNKINPMLKSNNGLCKDDETQTFEMITSQYLNKNFGRTIY